MGPSFYVEIYDIQIVYLITQKEQISNVLVTIVVVTEIKTKYKVELS